MLVGKRSSGGGGGSILKRTSSMSGISMELGNTETNHEASPSDNNSIDTTIPPFLRTCRLCRRRLVAGRDIYMYRGDTAFCSLECREEEMKEDERKDKKWKNNKVITSSTKNKQQDPPPSSSAAAKSHATQLAAA